MIEVIKEMKQAVEKGPISRQEKRAMERRKIKMDHKDRMDRMDHKGPRPPKDRSN